jgi:hypothetical protein
LLTFKSGMYTNAASGVLGSRFTSMHVCHWVRPNDSQRLSISSRQIN